MWVSHETIYHSIFVQGRGGLRRELHRCLRSGRAQRRQRTAHGLLRQYMPKGTDLSDNDADDLARVAASLNNRPRQTLGYLKPSEKVTELESVWP